MISRSIPQPLLVRGHHLTTLLLVVGQSVPGERVIAATHAEEAAEANHRSGVIEIRTRADAYLHPVISKKKPGNFYGPAEKRPGLNHIIYFLPFRALPVVR